MVPSPQFLAGSQQPPVGAAALVPPTAPLHNRAEAVTPPPQPGHETGEADPIPPTAGDKGLLRPRRARSVSPTSSHYRSTQQCRSPVLAFQSTPIEAFERQIQEMYQELDAVKYMSQPESRAKRGLPFFESIMREAILSQIKLPTIEPYNGTTNPDDHLSSFKSIMLFHGASDAILCRTFPSTLRGSARVWFGMLKPNSIRSFDELSRSFVIQFISSRRYRQRSDSLSELKQRKGKSLKSFLGHFNSAMLEVDHLN